MAAAAAALAIAAAAVSRITTTTAFLPSLHSFTHHLLLLHLTFLLALPPSLLLQQLLRIEGGKEDVRQIFRQGGVQPRTAL